MKKGLVFVMALLLLALPAMAEQGPKKWVDKVKKKDAQIQKEKEEAAKWKQLYEDTAKSSSVSAAKSEPKKECSSGSGIVSFLAGAGIGYGSSDMRSYEPKTAHGATVLGGAALLTAITMNISDGVQWQTAAWCIAAPGFIGYGGAYLVGQDNAQSKEKAAITASTVVSSTTTSSSGGSSGGTTNPPPPPPPPAPKFAAESKFSDITIGPAIFPNSRGGGTAMVIFNIPF